MPIKPVGPVEALKIARDKEEQSIVFYQKLAREYKVAADVFNFLLNEEMKHRKLIEDKITQMTRG